MMAGSNSITMRRRSGDTGRSQEPAWATSITPFQRGASGAVDLASRNRASVFMLKTYVRLGARTPHGGDLVDIAARTELARTELRPSSLIPAINHIVVNHAASRHFVRIFDGQKI